MNKVNMINSVSSNFRMHK